MSWDLGAAGGRSGARLLLSPTCPPPSPNLPPGGEIPTHLQRSEGEGARAHWLLSIPAQAWAFCVHHHSLVPQWLTNSGRGRVAVESVGNLRELHLLRTSVGAFLVLGVCSVRTACDICMSLQGTDPSHSSGSSGGSGGGHKPEVSGCGCSSCGKRHGQSRVVVVVVVSARS